MPLLLIFVCNLYNCFAPPSRKIPLITSITCSVAVGQLHKLPERIRRNRNLHILLAKRNRCKGKNLCRGSRLWFRHTFCLCTGGGRWAVVQGKRILHRQWDEEIHRQQSYGRYPAIRNRWRRELGHSDHQDQRCRPQRHPGRVRVVRRTDMQGRWVPERLLVCTHLIEPCPLHLHPNPPYSCHSVFNQSSVN